MNSIPIKSYPWDSATDSSLYRRRVTPLLVATQAAYVLFLSVGHFKGNPGLRWILVDLTLVAACLVPVLSLLSFVCTGAKIRVEVVSVLLFFAAMAIAVLWTEWTPYAIEKATRFFSITMMAAVLPALILTDVEGVKRFISLVIALGMLLSAGVLTQLAGGGFTGGLDERTAGFATVTTALAWDAGLALVGLYVYSLRGGKWRWLSLLCLPLFIAIVATGARGPLFSAIAVIAFLTFRFSKKKTYSVVVMLMLVAAAVFVLTDYTSFLPQGSVRRIMQLVQGQMDSSAHERVLLRQAAIEAIESKPFGMGFGGFARVYSFGSDTDRVYPHNLVLDVAVDNGILVAFFLAGIVLIAIRRSYRSAVASPELQPLFGMLLFAFRNSLMSGELNADRMLFGLIAISLQMPGLNREPQHHAA